MMLITFPIILLFFLHSRSEGTSTWLGQKHMQSIREKEDVPRGREECRPQQTESRQIRSTEDTRRSPRLVLDGLQ